MDQAGGQDPSGGFGEQHGNAPAQGGELVAVGVGNTHDDAFAAQPAQVTDTASGRASPSLLDQLEQQTFELHAENLRLRQRIEELKSALRESNETLEAARAMNRELMAEINRSAHPRPQH